MSNDQTPTQPKPQSQWAHHVGDHYSQQRAAYEQARAVAAYEGHGVAKWVWDRWTDAAREQVGAELQAQEQAGEGLQRLPGWLALKQQLNAVNARVAQIAAAEAERIEAEAEQ